MTGNGCIAVLLLYCSIAAGKAVLRRAHVNSKLLTVAIVIWAPLDNAAVCYILL